MDWPAVGAAGAKENEEDRIDIVATVSERLAFFVPELVVADKVTA
jgi:hypothetical protein